VGKVVLSANPEFSVGDFVFGHGIFSDYTIFPKAQGLRKVDSSVPLSYYLGVCGKSVMCN
jgi:NADPH-dependent curcumin reductase CurA